MPSSGTSNDEYIFAPGPSLPHAGQLFALNPSQRREELVEFVRHGLDLRLGGRMGDGQGQGFSQPSTTLRLLSRGRSGSKGVVDIIRRKCLPSLQFYARPPACTSRETARPCHRSKPQRGPVKAASRSQPDL